LYRAVADARPLVELETEARQPFSDEVVEDEPVFRGRLLVERLREGVTHVDEYLAAGVHEVDELAVAVLGLVAAGTVVRPESLLHLGEQLSLVLAEERELALRDLLEAVRGAQRVISS
jgi:hypothetical protein